MGNPKVRVGKAETEAAQWHARLGATPVSPQTIEEYFTWRQKAENLAAYERVDKVWRESGDLRGDPALAGALADAMSRNNTRKRETDATRRLLGFAAVGAAAAVAVLGWNLIQLRGVHATGVGEQQLVQLADGSSVRLDTGSRIRVRFDGARRLVELEQGQAMFTVAHDVGRPFVVTAGEARVTAVGTVFDVRREGEAVRVTLVSGAVDVAANSQGAGQRMAAGHQAKVVGRRVQTASVDVGSETSWTEGRIVFRDTPLKSAVAEVNRYLTDPVELDAPSLETESFNGVFNTGDRDAFVSAASGALDLRVTPGRDGAIRLSAEK